MPRIAAPRPWCLPPLRNPNQRTRTFLCSTSWPFSGFRGLAQFETLRLPGGRLRQLLANIEPARIFPRACALLQLPLDRLEQGGIGHIAVLEHQDRFGFRQAVGVFVADDGCLEYRLVRQQRRLDIERRDPHPAHLEHVVGAALTIVVAVRVAEELFTRIDPFADKGPQALCALMPIAIASRRTADDQLADFS